MKIKYKKITVDVEGVKPERCMCCLNNPKPRGLQFHHFGYAYTTEEVRKKPNLALKNGVWLCYHCHRTANCLRVVEEDYRRVRILDMLKRVGIKEMSE